MAARDRIVFVRPSGADWICFLQLRSISTQAPAAIASGEMIN
jgi:hypothetical protein